MSAFDTKSAPGHARRTRRRARSCLRVAVVAEARYLQQRQPAAFVAALVHAGHRAQVMVPETLVLDLNAVQPLPADGVVARGHSDVLLAVLRLLEMSGLPTINSAAAVARVRDKAGMGALLRSAGIPTPRTWLGAPASLASTVPRECYPLVLKPVFGDNCQGLRLARNPEALAGHPDGVVLAQPYLPSDGYDLKLYVIGADVWGVRKPSPFRPAGPPVSSPGRVVALTPELDALARRCGQLFGLELYGVDCLQTPQGPVVIEVNDFPNYTGLPDAPVYAVDYVVGRFAEVS